MSAYKVTSNFVFEKANYAAGTEIQISDKKAEKINKRGQVSHPDLSPFLLPVKEEKSREADK